MSSPTQSPRTAAPGPLDQPYLILVLTVMFWGGNAVAGKAAVGHIDPYLLATLRWLFAFLIVLPFAIRPLKRDLPVIRQKWWLLLIYGAVGFGAFNLLLYLGAQYTSGVNVALDQVSVNIFVMALNFAFFRTRVKALQLVGVVLTITGVALTTTHGDLTRLLALDINFGDALMLLACFAYAVYSVILRFRPATHWLSFLAVTLLAAAVFCFAFFLMLGGGFRALLPALSAITPQGWWIVAYATIFPSIMSQMLYVRGVEMIGPNRASLFINLIPFFGTLGAVLILGERLESFHFVAGLLIVLGIVLAEWAARRSR